MFGKHAVHVPMNFIVQDMTDKGEPAVICVAQSRGPRTRQLFFTDEPFTHTLILGDVVIRPHLVIGSNHLRGTGVAGLARFDVPPEEWYSKGKMLLNNLPGQV